jgi:hypothetical protein
LIFPLGENEKEEEEEEEEESQPSLYGLVGGGSGVVRLSDGLCCVCVCVCDGMAMAGEILRWSVGSRQRVLTHADISVVYLQRSGPFQGSASSLLFLSHFISVEFCFVFILFFCFFEGEKKNF